MILGCCKMFTASLVSAENSPHDMQKSLDIAQIPLGWGWIVLLLWGLEFYSKNLKILLCNYGKAFKAWVAKLQHEISSRHWSNEWTLHYQIGSKSMRHYWVGRKIGHKVEKKDCTKKSIACMIYRYRILFMHKSYEYVYVHI